MAEKIIKIGELIPDNQNFNKGNQFGESLIEKSFDKFGAGRSILIDKNGKIIAGNKSTQKFVEQGGENVIVVETDGKTLVAVKRTDIDLDSKQGREMALADNATAKANITWDFDVLNDWEMPLDDWGIVDSFTDSDELTDEFSLKDGDREPFQQMTFTLADEQATEIKNAMKDAQHSDAFKFAPMFGNENSNGNALYFIVSQWQQQRT